MATMPYECDCGWGGDTESGLLKHLGHVHGLGVRTPPDEESEAERVLNKTLLEARAEIERLTKERDEAVRHAEALDTQVDALGLEAEEARTERDAAQRELTNVLEALDAQPSESAADAARRMRSKLEESIDSVANAARLVVTARAEEAAARFDRETLRDEFAKAAMQGLLANPDGPTDGRGVADAAYCYADAMLKEREPAKTTPPEPEADGVYPCVCGWMCSGKAAYLKHARKCPRVTDKRGLDQAPDTVITHRCSGCGAAYQTRGALETHQRDLCPVRGVVTRGKPDAS